ncbi:MAG: TspO/MBR family protein [Minisyncoccales bacterium]
MKRKNIFKLIASIVICQAAALIGSMFTMPAVGGWYAELNKPSWTPSGGVIGAAWTVIYLLMGVSLYLAWAKNFQISENLSGMAARAWNCISQKLLDGAWQKQNIIAVFSVQLILNVLWSFVFFELKMPGWAFFELLMLWAAIAYTIANFRRVSKPAAYLLLPYIAWVTFAGYLNFVIWQMN